MLKLLKTVVSGMLAIHPDKAAAWDSAGAVKRVKAWAGATDAPNAKFKKAFLWFDDQNADNFTGYKLPIGDVFSGELHAVYKAVTSAEGAINGARGGVDISEADKTAILKKIDSYKTKWDANKHFDGEEVILTAAYEVKQVPEVDEDHPNFEFVQKAIENGAVINKAMAYGQVKVLVSNSAVDRYGESILVDGIDLSQVKRNPVLLWAHDYAGYRAPLGRIMQLTKSGGDLYATVEFDYDIYDFADLIYKQVLRGTVSAVSIGGIVTKWSEDFSVVEKLEMIELSVVPVGAHRDALVVAKSFGVSAADYQSKLDSFIEKAVLDKYNNVGNDDLNNHIQSLEKILAILKQTKELRGTKETKATRTVKLITLRKAAGEAGYHAGQIGKIIKIKLKGT